MTSNDIPRDARLLDCRIPEGRAVQGLTYGAHVQASGWSGYWITVDGEIWGIARETPASDELVGETDEDLVWAINEELTDLALHEALTRTGKEA